MQIFQKIRATRARTWQLLEMLNDSFWLRPASIVLGAIALAELLTSVERAELLPLNAVSEWLYEGGETGARTLLGAIAGSTIGVAGTVFSITIATLTLASNQLGPRLLRNFTSDRSNQITLGVYLGTFSYALMVLRSVRGADEAFVPHLAITGAIALALLCVGLLIHFVHHVASLINSETVIEMVFEDLRQNLMKWTTLDPQWDPPSPETWANGQVFSDERHGFIQQLDEQSIADWAEHNGAAIRLQARPGDFVFPGAPLGIVVPAGADPTNILRATMALGAQPTASMDIEFTVLQLVDIAVRALSPGINDPNTAIRVIDRLGAALCMLVTRRMLTGVVARQGRVVLQRDTTTYDGMTDAMFHMIRQNAATSPSVLIRMLEVLAVVAECERREDRLATLERHATMVLADALRNIQNEEDRKTVQGRADRFVSIVASRRLASAHQVAACMN
jgi:uncharacterized membrane protein